MLLSRDSSADSDSNVPYDNEAQSPSWVPAMMTIAAIPFFLGSDVTLAVVAAIAATCVVVALSIFAWVKYRFPRPVEGTIGFFHPFADGGGGGERVLWAAVQALQEHRPDLQIVIYCGEGCTPASLAEQAAYRFNLRIAPTFRVIPLPSRDRLLPDHYRRFTMIRQAVASVRVAAAGLAKVVPSVWLDTTGWAFPYPLVRLTGSKVAAYVHYPTISTDMLSRVRDRAASFNNNADIAGSAGKSGAKLAYYHAFAALYGAVGGCASVAMVNSSWTRRHVAQLWWRRQRPTLVYPPVDTAALQALPLDRRLKRLYIVSVAQFRPEKEHEVQLRALAAARARAHAGRLPDPAVAQAVLSAKLQLIGGCRGSGDEARLAALRQLATELGLGEEAIEFRVNVPFEELRAVLGDAMAGLHSMADEHFGISVVEYMAAGVIAIAHSSGGPKEDIVVDEEATGREGGGPQPTGFLCRGIEAYTEALIKVVGMGQAERLSMAAAARRRAAAFSDERFKREFVQAMRGVLPPMA